MKKLLNLYIFLFAILCSLNSFAKMPSPLNVAPSEYDLVFDELAATWDEGMPLGNSIVGSLIWQKGNSLRMSLDRIDLWDLRPVDSLSGSNFKFDWVYDQVMKGDYKPVQDKLDYSYNRMPAPSKIPGAGLEFAMAETGAPNSVRLLLNNALCEITWDNGMRMQAFVHASEPVGWFRIENAGESFVPELIPPAYDTSESDDSGFNSLVGSNLERLGYKQGEVVKTDNTITYHQEGWGDFHYDVTVKWENKDNVLTGVWSVSSSMSDNTAAGYVYEAFRRGIVADYKSHMSFWNKFWKQSSINIPDKVLAKQYANEMYKFGSAAREYSYPISLQAVWTADDGKLPPWKGDYHHDLNTQLSYWPCYTGNYLSEGLGYLNTLWDQRETNRRYTMDYYGKEGLNVPGVCTLTGEPMGGWCQYAMSPTVSAWLAQHFYLHYKYSGDKKFLEERAYPYIKDVAVFLEGVTYIDSEGIRRLPISSSPEVNDNSIKAWFHTMTNYDLSLIRFVFSAASELAGEMSLTAEAEHWAGMAGQMGDFDIDESGCLTIAEGFPYNFSHRHFSHSMAIHPLGIIDWNNGEKDREIIKATISRLDEVGPDYWVGYSYSWLGNLKARAMDGEGAAEALRIFAEHFCLKNTFHANGDQTKTGKSKFTYRPFTLEGNFAFASGIQDMLIQSHTGVIRLFPAVPESWKDVSFDNLRTYGAFLVSCERTGGIIREVTVTSEKGGVLRMADPFGGNNIKVKGTKKKVIAENGIISLDMSPGQTVVMRM